MDKPDMNLDKIVSICRLEKKHNAKLYHQTKLLLELYRKVVWSVENRVSTISSRRPRISEAIESRIFSII